ncbi:Hypothetical protein I5071_61360 [Sandaracinus amylolyticus]|nr:Hypothetical protein I5071_61360 [Sandaracinus amylolyticus]
MLACVTSPPSIDSVMHETRALVRELGLEHVEPVVIADRSNLVLHLAPHPLVARVAMATSMVRVGMQWLRREVELSRFLDARGASVTRPSTTIDAGPFERAGLVISVWDLETITANAIDPQRAGARLAEAHRLLAAHDAPALPEWGGWDEARAVLERARESGAWSASEAHRVASAWERAERIVESARARTASFQPVHGDAHLGNVLATSRGPVWTDWEDAFVGPIEWDLACLRSKAELFGEERETIDAITAAYDGPYDPELARELGLVRNLQVIPWLAVFAERDPSLLPRMRARIAKL